MSRFARVARAAFAALLVSACSPDEVLSPTPQRELSPAVQQAAIRIRVDARSFEATVVETGFITGEGSSASFATAQAPGAVMGAGAIALETGNVTRSTVRLRRTLVTFDVAIINKLSSVELLTPTAPAPPPGVNGILLYPVRLTVLSGPTDRKVEESSDWDGSARDFLGGMTCLAQAPSCAPYEAFPAPLLPGDRTAPRTVGFIIDKDVQAFDVFMIVTADQRDRPMGGIGGLAYSKVNGRLAGATITLNPGGLTATTDATGEYSFARVDTGTYALSVSDLPENCPAAPDRTVRVTANGSAQATFEVPCNPLVTVTGVSPDNGPNVVQTPITITGTNFLNVTAVTIAGRPVNTLVVVSSTQITGKISSGGQISGPGDVLVTSSTHGRGSCSACYTFNPRPKILSMTPNTSPLAGGGAFTIRGENFVNVTDVGLGTDVTAYTVVSSSEITGIIPAGVEAGLTSVSVGSSSHSIGFCDTCFTYLPAMSIATVSPAAGLQVGGTTVTITGTNFLDLTSVTIGGIALTIQSQSETAIVGTTGASAGSGAKDVVVTSSTHGNATLAGGFTYNATLTISDVSPVSAPTTSSVSMTIDGTNFIGVTDVTVGGLALASLLVTETSITGILPSSTLEGPGDVIVVSPSHGTATCVGCYRFMPRMTITRIEPASGPLAGGNAVRIVGTNLQIATVRFGGVSSQGSPQHEGDSAMTAIVPARAQAEAVDVSLTSKSNGSLICAGCYEYVAPPISVTINQHVDQSDPTNASSMLFTVVFSQPVTGFTGSDISFTGSTVGGTLVATALDAGATYRVLVQGHTSSGVVVASVRAGAVTNASGIPSLASTSTDNTITFDNVAPSVTINKASGQPDPTNAGPILFTIAFSEPVTAFTAEDVDLSGSTFGGLVRTLSGSGTTYTLSVNGAGLNGVGTVVASMPAFRVIDAAGLPNTASTSTDNVVAFDNVGPSVTINQASGQSDPTSTSPILFSVLFSEPVTGFSAADVDLASTLGGLVASVSGSGASYTVSVTGMTGNGTVLAAIRAGGATDVLGNGNLASTSTDNAVSFDPAPTVTINQAAGQADPTKVSPLQYTVVFSEPVTGFTAADVAIIDPPVPLNQLEVTLSGSGAIYTVSIAVTTIAQGDIVALIRAGRAADLAGNPNLESTSTDNTVHFDNKGPASSIVTFAPDPTNSDAIVFDVHFSAPVTGFTGSDITFAGSTVGGTLVATVIGTHASNGYDVRVTGHTSSGILRAAVRAGAATDALGNASSASGSAEVEFDNDGPTVIIRKAEGQADPTTTSPIRFEVIFSEPVTGFTAADVSINAPAFPTGLVVSVSGGGRQYFVNIAVTTPGSGNIIASIPAGKATDLAGNTSLASTSNDNGVFMNSPLTVTINKASGQADPTNVSPVQYTVQFNAPVTGFTAADVSLNAPAFPTGLVVSVSGSGASYTVSIAVTTPGSGNIIASIPAGRVTDSLGNTNLASTSSDNGVFFNGASSLRAPLPGSRATRR